MRIIKNGISLACKPTFLNMDFNLEQIQMDNLVSNGFGNNPMLVLTLIP